MKKTVTFYFALGSLFCSAATATETTLLYEDFESKIFPAEGWEIIDNHTEGFNDAYGAWKLYTNESSGRLAGYSSIEVQTSYNETAKDEWVVTPGLTIDNDQYSVSFMWYAQKDGAEKGYYTFQVKASQDNGATWDTLWDCMNQNDVESSLSDWPWQAWTKYTSTVSLAAYSGKTIKIAFYYASAPVNGYNHGRFELDNIKVSTEKADVTPIPNGTNAYKFENCYLDLTAKSEMLTITNIGNGTLEITAISGLEGTNFSTTLATGCSLRNGEELGYYILYTPTMESARDAVLKIETNGGDFEVTLSATKVMLEEGYTLESFEGSEAYPAGWTNTGWKKSSYFVSQGEKSACNSILQNCYLYSPRIDLSSGGHQIVFDYYESFEDENGSLVPENFMALDIKIDDAEEWTEIWYTDTANYNCWVRDTIDLSRYASDNVRLRWSYQATDWSAGFETVASDIYLDNIVLPPLYGAAGLPSAATNPSPADKATGCSYNAITLSWSPVQFATAYDLIVKSGENVIASANGLTETTYALTSDMLAPATSYTWSVPPHNATGAALDVPTWNFTTMEDQTIRQFPYFYGFEGDAYPALGWQLLGDGTPWKRSEISPYEGTYTAFVFQPSNRDGLQSMLQSVPVAIPADGKEYILEFVWGKERPITLSSLPEGSEYVAPEPTADGDTLYCEIALDGNNVWNVLDFTVEETYWQKPTISLKDYAGKTVLFRWRYYAKFGGRSEAASIDNIFIAEKELSELTANNRANDICVYPNPATHTIAINTQGNTLVTIYNISGEKVMQSTEKQISIESLPTGVYIVRVIVGTDSYAVRLIKH